MSLFDEFDVFVTLTGFNHYPNAKRLVDGDIVTLCREADNEFDSCAVSVYSEFGKIGYVANSKNTVRDGTLSATYLSELIENTAKAVVTEGGYYEAVCKVLDVYDTDKLILKACGLYNKGEYSAAVPLFLKICERYNSLLLMQYTADCLIKLERYNDALSFAKDAVELDKNNKTSLMMYATALHKLGEYKQAAELYRKILAIGENKVVEEALNECIRLEKR